MKNQYFADINDYRKYGLLRILAGRGTFKTTVCWMLTPDDQRKGGVFTGYLGDPARWRHYDPELFDLLKSYIAQPQVRSVHWAETKEIIPGATYYSRLLCVKRDDRQQFFHDLRAISAGQDLVFFDPDNGIEVKSVSYGTRYSNKYVFWGEIADTFTQHQSIMVYQHFAHIKRDIYIRRMVDLVFEKMPTSMAVAFSTAQVLFLLVAQPEHEKYLEEKYAEIRAIWATQIQAERFWRA